MAAGNRTPWTAERIVCLKRMWASGTPRNAMAKALDMGWSSVLEKAQELNLGPPPDRRDGRGERSRAVGELRHRASLGFRDPIELKPCNSLFGAPIKAVDADTRALIDAALAKRASA